MGGSEDSLRGPAQRAFVTLIECVRREWGGRVKAFYLTQAYPVDIRDRAERGQGKNTHGGGMGREFELRSLIGTTDATPTHLLQLQVQQPLVGLGLSLPSFSILFVPHGAPAPGMVPGT